MSLSESSARQWQLARLAAMFIGGVLAFMILYNKISGPRSGLETDWIAFDRAADRILAGEPVYRPINSSTETLPYLYPPFALWLALPLAPFGFVTSWVFTVIAMASATMAGFAQLTKHAATEYRGAAIAIATTTGCVVSSIIIGQYSGLYVLAVGLAVAAWHQDRQGVAGLALGLLWIKPNLAVPLLVAITWGRAWPAVRSFIGVGVGLVGSSLVFGVHQWNGFFSNAERMVELQRLNIVPVDKMVTFQAFMQEVLGFSSSSIWLWAGWLVAALASGVATLIVWTKAAQAASIERAFGVLLAFMVAANPRLYFYDALLLVAAALLLYSAAPTFHRAKTSHLVAVLCTIAWIGSWGAVWRGLNVLVGPAALLLCIVVGVDAITARRDKAEVTNLQPVLHELPEAA